MINNLRKLGCLCHSDIKGFFSPRVLALRQSVMVGKEQSCLCDLEVLLMRTGALLVKPVIGDVYH